MSYPFSDDYGEVLDDRQTFPQHRVETSKPKVVERPKCPCCGTSDYYGEGCFNRACENRITAADI